MKSGNNHGHEVIRMRILMYDLARSFFAQAPDDERCRMWHVMFSALTEVRQEPEISSAAGKIVEVLDKQGGEGVRKEYSALFLDPYSESRLNRTTSWYADGKNLGPSLAAVRQLMHEAGIRRTDDYHEPEDSLEVLLDSMILLLEEAEEKGEEHGHELRQRIFLDFIMPLLDAMIPYMEKMDDFPFYQACAGYLKAWLIIERPFAQ